MVIVISVKVSVFIHAVIGAGQSAAAAAVAGSNMPPLPSNVAARMTNQSLSSYYGAVAVYSSKLSRSRPISATTSKPSFTGLLVIVSSFVIIFGQLYCSLQDTPTTASQVQAWKIMHRPDLHLEIDTGKSDRGSIVNFINFRKAFDSIHRPALWKILKQYGLPTKVITIIQFLPCDAMQSVVMRQCKSNSEFKGNR